MFRKISLTYTLEMFAGVAHLCKHSDKFLSVQGTILQRSRHYICVVSPVPELSRVCRSLLLHLCHLQLINTKHNKNIRSNIHILPVSIHLKCCTYHGGPGETVRFTVTSHFHGKHVELSICFVYLTQHHELRMYS